MRMTYSNFYPRSPCGERLQTGPAEPCVSQISIHALLAESDQLIYSINTKSGQFLSTLSLRRATHAQRRAPPQQPNFYPRSPCGERHQDKVFLPPAQKISIHALLAESDITSLKVFSICSHFYPRSPCGERHDTSSLMQCQVKFLSTLSLRRATKLIDKRCQFNGFLSTLSLRRATTRPIPAVTRVANFYPRSPCGERPMQIVVVIMYALISIHALLAESDPANWFDLWGWADISIHALLAESDQYACKGV